MIDIRDVCTGNSYACKFRVDVWVDEHDQPTLTAEQVRGTSTYEGFGVLTTRDVEQELVIVVDEHTGFEFVVPWSDIWDVDTVEWRDP